MKDKLLKIYKNVHKDKYDYSKFEYINSRTKSIIICPKHGEFEQLPQTHKKSGCKKCSIFNRSGINTFKIESINIHGELYDYTEVVYKNNFTKVKIKCYKHGYFKITPKLHLRGNGCRKCYIESLKCDIDNIIDRANKVHNHKYDYSKFKYYGMDNKSIIICPKHGEFEQRVNNHINMQQGCDECKNEKKRVDYKHFINKASKIHKNKYKYPESNKVFDYKTTLTIICPIHGEFEQFPSNHYKYGCMLCGGSRGERIIMEYLDNENIIYEREKRFKKCLFKNKLRFDFYLPNYNICIEYNGKQHYEPIEYMGGENRFKEQLIKDGIKRKYCSDNDIYLMEIKYDLSQNDIIKYLDKFFKKIISTKC